MRNDFVFVVRCVKRERGSVFLSILRALFGEKELQCKFGELLGDRFSP
jgi:hypothetical protein